MRLSLYTFVRNGLYFDYHVVAMLKHHIPLADEIIVNEAFSTDGTYEAIRSLHSKIQIHRFAWDDHDPINQRRKYVDRTRGLCTGDWCVMLDADEFIPEWEFDRLRQFCKTTDKHIARFRFLHFYGNYRVYCRDIQNQKLLPEFGNRIHRNLPDIEVWGDASTVRLRGAADERDHSSEHFLCHHFSSVRNPARLRHKWRIQKLRNVDNRRNWIPAFLFDLLPHSWADADFINDLDVYDGPFIKAVLDNPSEFVRDGMRMYDRVRTMRARETTARQGPV